MKLELKHILPYLPYDLKALSVFHGVNLIRSVDVWGASTLLNDDSDKKMMLIPISCLAEEIEHNGERFVPIDRLLRSINSSVGDFLYQVREDDYFDVDDCPYYIVRKLAEWHIDFQGLIPAGLAVDKREVK